jgi:endonuclease III
VLSRLGFLPPRVDIKASHDFLQDLVPKDIRRSLHVNLIHHGRRVCTPRVPACDRCVLLSVCPAGRGIEKVADSSQAVLGAPFNTLMPS